MMDGATHDHNAAERVDLRFPATLNQLSLARLLTVAVMTRADFDGDAVEDVRMAVDEACTQLIAYAAEGGEMRCSFITGLGGVTVKLSVAKGPCAEVQKTGLGWHIIEALTDSVVVRNASAENGLEMSVVELRKRKSSLTR